jgi:hypothetical protein
VRQNPFKSTTVASPIPSLNGHCPAFPPPHLHHFPARSPASSSCKAQAPPAFLASSLRFFVCCPSTGVHHNLTQMHTQKMRSKKSFFLPLPSVAKLLTNYRKSLFLTKYDILENNLILLK